MTTGFSGVRRVLFDGPTIELVAAQVREKRTSRALRIKHVQSHMLPVLRDDREISLGFRTAIAQDDPDQSPLIEQPSSHRVAATFRHFANGLSNPAQERPARARPPRRVKKYDGLRSLEPKGEGFVVVAVDDPGITREQAALLVPPLVVGWPDPARFPVVDVKVNQRQPSLRG